MSSRCCSSVFALPGKTGFVATVRSSWLEFEPFGDKLPRCTREITACIAKSLSVDAAHFQCIRHAIDGQHIRRYAIVDLVCFRVAYHFIKRIFHYIQQPFVHFTFTPEESLPVLYPLEITHSNAACITKDIRHRKDALAINDRVRLPGCR